MLTEREIDLVLGKDSVIVSRPKETLSFREWLITKKGIAPLSVKHNTSYVNHLLRDNNTPFPTKDDAERIALRVLSSDYSKSYQKHLLTALELYMEYTGHPSTSRNPSLRKDPRKYLTQDQLKRLIRGARDYRDFAMLIMFCTTGMRLNELQDAQCRDLTCIEG